MQWKKYVPVRDKEQEISFSTTATPREKYYRIELYQSMLADPAFAITLLAHQLTDALVKKQHLISIDHENYLFHVDLICIYLGFGLFMANRKSMPADWSNYQFVVTPEMNGYINALLCWLSDSDENSVLPYLATFPQELFKNNFQYLATTKETLLSPSRIAIAEQCHKRIHASTSAMINHDYIRAEIEDEALCELLPDNYGVYNHWGYVRLRARNYANAIPLFSKAIALDAYCDFAFNNRGYCHLMLGDFDQAIPDLDAALELNPKNAFAWRNTGVYYLLTGKTADALTHFHKARELDPETEMIDFYFALAYRQAENAEKAAEHRAKFEANDGYNDSVFSLDAEL